VAVRFVDICEIVYIHYIFQLSFHKTILHFEISWLKMYCPQKRPQINYRILCLHLICCIVTPLYYVANEYNF